MANISMMKDQRNRLMDNFVALVKQVTNLNNDDDDSDDSG